MEKVDFRATDNGWVSSDVFTFVVDIFGLSFLYRSSVPKLRETVVRTFTEKQFDFLSAVNMQKMTPFAGHRQR